MLEGCALGCPQPLGVILRYLAFAAIFALCLDKPATARGRPSTPPAFAHLENLWKTVSDYSMDIEAHEVLGTESADNELHYAFRRPDRARLDVIAGNKSGSTVVLDDAEHVTAYMRAYSVFKKHGDVHDKDLTSLRGNGIRNPNVSDVIACFEAHAKDLHQIPGPVVDGQPTDEVQLPYTEVSCPDDPPNDRGEITLDAIDIARDTGYIVLRKRYAGSEIVESWSISDYKINAGIADADLE